MPPINIVTTHVLRILNNESVNIAVIAIALGVKDVVKFHKMSPFPPPPPRRDPSRAPLTIVTTLKALNLRVIHNRFDRNRPSPFWENVKNMNFPYISLCTCTYIYMSMWTLTPKRVTCFSMYPLDLYHFDTECPEVSKYLKS